MNREKFIKTFAGLKEHLIVRLTHRMVGSSDIGRSSAGSTRALLLLDSYTAMNPHYNHKQFSRAVRLGWAIELMQSFLLICDDITDGGVTRRGRPCWHTLPEIGLTAVTDSILLESSIDLLVSEEFGHEHLFEPIVSSIQQMKQKTVLGQMLDGFTRGSVDCTNDRYRQIVDYKTAHYTFFLPVQLALILADRRDSFDSLQQLCYDIGYYFQAQDDYLDCFGDVSLTGKVGTDIREGKCTWVTSTAAALLETSHSDRVIFEEHFGRKNAQAVEIVEKLLVKLDLPQLYRKFESEQYTKLDAQIGKMSIIPLRSVFHRQLDNIRKRRK